jgi:hypothetical protein
MTLVVDCGRLGESVSECSTRAVWRELLVVSRVHCGSSRLIVIAFVSSVDSRCTVSMRLCWAGVLFVSMPAVVYQPQTQGKGGWGCRACHHPFPKRRYQN